MAKWEKRCKDILDRERKKHHAVWELATKLEEVIHGFNPISREELKKEINPLIASVKLHDSVITEVKYEDRYKNNECEENQMLLTVSIVGDFSGSIVIGTCGGTRNTKTGRIPIFYVSSYDKNVYSLKMDEMKQMYRKYHKYSVESLIDLFLEKQTYFRYDDRFKSYEICNKKPSSYGDSINGYIRSYNDDKEVKLHKRTFDNINKLRCCDDVMQFAEDKLNGVSESVTYEWTEYRL